jgi:hypothetical protein
LGGSGAIGVCSARSDEFHQAEIPAGEFVEADEDKLGLLPAAGNVFSRATAAACNWEIVVQEALRCFRCIEKIAVVP